VTDKDKVALVSSQALDDSTGYARQFAQTAALFGKGENYNERKYYHFKLSPDPADGATPEQVHKFAEEMAAKCFPAHECVIATHTDKPHVHAHIVVNAVSFEDGRKLRIPTSEYTRMKDLANEVGLTYGFSPLDFRQPSKDKTKSREKQLLLRGGIGWKDELKNVISEAKQTSASFDAFTQHLQNYGITIERNTEKTISFKHPEKQKPIRGNSLGEDFTKEAIIFAIAQHADRAVAHATQSNPGAAIAKRTIPSVDRTRTDSVGKHHAQTDIDRIYGTIRDIKGTAKRFSPTGRSSLPTGQADARRSTNQSDNVKQGADRQHRPKRREHER